jgi:hypothetical protein
VDLPECTLTLCEIAMLRLYTWDLYKPWNNALRGVTAEHKPDDDAGVADWATCLAVLYSAVVKLSYLTPADASGKPVAKVWRGVDEGTGQLPADFYQPTVANSSFPGGAEVRGSRSSSGLCTAAAACSHDAFGRQASQPAFMSTTDDIWMAYTYSGGWDTPASILEFEFNAASRGAAIRCAAPPRKRPAVRTHS